MKKVLHRADSRGHHNFGWLDTHHTFSFGQYQNSDRMHFGALRVLNDDIVSPGNGFGRHPHHDMEIVSIPLSGNLAHADSTGREEVIRSGDVQIMSAGSGIQHSEYNHSNTEHVNFLQVWVLPKQLGIQPRYDQKTFAAADQQDRWQVVVSSDRTTGGIWINQDAQFALGDFNPGADATYPLALPCNGVYLFVIECEVEVAGETLGRRDAIGLWDGINAVTIKALKASQLLMIEVPMLELQHASH